VEVEPENSPYEVALFFLLIGSLAVARFGLEPSAHAEMSPSLGRVGFCGQRVGAFLEGGRHCSTELRERGSGLRPPCAVRPELT
jgi:hypothetical protein